MEKDDILQQIQSFLESQGIVEFSPIQKRAIVHVLRGQSVLLLAPTGSGKTEAALIPILYKLAKVKQKKELFGIYVIYVTPLRALNRDVLRRIESLCELLGLTVAVRHGDTTQYARRKQAIIPPHLLITTPESLQAILPAKRLRYHLKTVFAVVIDEIHELADSKRGVQLSLGLERLERITEKPLQRVGLSATVGNPKEIAALLGGSNTKVDIIWAGYENRRFQLKVESPRPTKTDEEAARKIVYPKYSTARLRRIIELIEYHTTTIVFVNTRSFAEVLGSKMHAMKPPFEFDVHHGSLSKESRTEAEHRLKSGESKAIIATSSLELGIDIGTADLVVQYSSPRVVMRAVQRIGRSGHGVGRVPKGVILATWNIDDILESGVIVRRAKANRVEDARIPTEPLDVLIHQICGILMDVGQIDVENLIGIIRGAFPYANVTHETIDQVIQFMTERRIIRKENNTISMTGKTRIFYYENLSTIPDTRQITAVDITTRAPIGVLDEDYVLDSLNVGDVFVIRGRPWQVITIEDEEVICSSANDASTESPRWIGEMIPVPYQVATEVADLWSHISDGDPSEISVELERQYGISAKVHEFIYDTIKSCKDMLRALPSKRHIIIEDSPEGIVLHAPYGTKTNETLGIVLSALLTTRMGRDVGFERDPYRIVIISDERIDPQHVIDAFMEYDSKQIADILRMAVRQTQTFASRFLHVGRRMGVIRKEARAKDLPMQRIIKTLQATPVFQEAMNEVLEEKLDEKRMIRIFNEIHNGHTSIKITKTEKSSPFAKLVIEERTRFEVIGEITEEAEILRLLEERLLSQRVRLVCVGEGDWSSTRSLRTLSDPIQCPLCGSKRIAITFPNDARLLKIIKAILRGDEVTEEDEKKFRRADLMATLIANYGKQAILTLVGRGIGPTSAARLLRPGLSRIELLRLIAKAEREYAKTRPFWR